MGQFGTELWKAKMFKTHKNFLVIMFTVMLMSVEINSNFMTLFTGTTNEQAAFINNQNVGIVRQNFQSNPVSSGAGLSGSCVCRCDCCPCCPCAPDQEFEYIDTK